MQPRFGLKGRARTLRRSGQALGQRKAHSGRTTCEQRANKILFSLQACTYMVRKENIRKGFGDFWELKGGLTWCARGEIPGFDRERWMGVAVPSFNKNPRPGIGTAEVGAKACGC